MIIDAIVGLGLSKTSCAICPENSATDASVIQFFAGLKRLVRHRVRQRNCIVKPGLHLRIPVGHALQRPSQRVLST